MRKGLFIVALAVLVVGSIGLVQKLDEQPIARDAGGVPAQPPSTGAEAVAPSAFGEDAVPAAEAVSGSALEAQRLLRAREFAALTRLIEAKQAPVEESVRHEGELARVMLAFAVADPTLMPLFDAWVAAQPDTYAPRLARGAHRVALAWAQRGKKVARETSDEQLAGMREYLGEAVEDARAAVRGNPRLTEGYVLLIRAAMGYGDSRACLRVADLAFAHVPASMRVRAALGYCLLPRWGGSYEALADFARESQAEADRNPALLALLGFVDWDRGRVAAEERRYDAAIALFTHALEMGEHWQFYRDRAQAYLHQHRDTQALADVARALALAPDEPDTLVLRVRILTSLRKWSDAVADAQLVAELDPTNGDLAWFRGHELEDAAHQGSQLLETTKDVDGAIARLTWGVRLTGGSADIYYWRGRAYLQKNDQARALGDLEQAIRLDPHHFDAYQNVDWILTQRGAWDEIIRRWSRYIELEPLNGEAYLERGGAYHRRGDASQALADARKACDLGTQKACEIGRR